MLALHLITSTPDTAWVSLTRRVILLNDDMFRFFSDISLLSWQLVAAPPGLTCARTPAVRHSPWISGDPPESHPSLGYHSHRTGEPPRGVIWQFEESWNKKFETNIVIMDLSDQHSMLTSEPTAATSLDTVMRGPLPSGWTEHRTQVRYFDTNMRGW